MNNEPASSDSEPDGAGQAKPEPPPDLVSEAPPPATGLPIEAPSVEPGPAEAEVPADDAAVEGGPEAAVPSDASTTSGPRPSGPKKRKKARRRPPVRPTKPAPLAPELRSEAEAAATARVLAEGRSPAKTIRAALDAMRSGTSTAFLGRFGRGRTGGLDERRLRALRDRFAEVLTLEERRVGIRALLKERGALTDETQVKLAAAERVGEMEDLAAPYLPVVASRATVARGHGLQSLAEAIRAAVDPAPLSELAKPFLPEDAEATAIDQALAGARDVLAEELCLDPTLRGALRRLFQNEGVLSVGLRSERKGDVGRHGSLIGFRQRALSAPALKVLAIRRAEKERVVVTTLEPPEPKALGIVHECAAPDGHPYAGFLRAAAEDGYRRILKPLLQNELREEVKQDADALALSTFERNFRNLLLGPYAGGRRTLGLRPDVMNGHRWCAVDEGGDPIGSGQLPHAPTAGRDACVEELRQVLRTCACDAIAVGTTGGRADAVKLAKDAVADRPDITVIEVADGGTRAVESMGPFEMDERPTVPAECRGALSIARRFQDPLAELLPIDPKALNLGPGMHDVHQGRLRSMFRDVLESAIAHAGFDPNTAGVDVIAHAPGFDRRAAQALVAWRGLGGRLESKAQLAAVDGVGPDVAEQAVGFMRIADARDPRDRAQLHPEHFEIVDRMATNANTDVETLFADGHARARVRLAELVDEQTDIHLLRQVLFQLTAGTRDPRPRIGAMIPPPEGVTLESLAPGLILEARVLRSAPFGVFVDVGLGVDALIPTPHIGDRPGLEQAVVAPVGAIVTVRVLEIDPKKKKLTLSMRRDDDAHSGAPRGRGPGGARRPALRSGTPREDARRERTGAGTVGEQRGAGRDRSRGRDGGPRGPASGDRSPSAGAGRGPGAGAGRGAGAGAGAPRVRRKGRAQKGGKPEAGFSIFDRRSRDERGAPRRISLKADDPKGSEDATVDESALTPEQLMQRKLDDLRRRLEGDRH